MNKAHEHIVNSLPDMIRLDQTLESFSKATGFDLVDFNDAVIIRKQDLICLTDDGVIVDDILRTLFKKLSKKVDHFKIKCSTGQHSYRLIHLNNRINPFGDENKDRLYAIARDNHKKSVFKFNA